MYYCVSVSVSKSPVCGIWIRLRRGLVLRPFAGSPSVAHQWQIWIDMLLLSVSWLLFVVGGAWRKTITSTRT